MDDVPESWLWSDTTLERNFGKPDSFTIDPSLLATSAADSCIEHSSLSQPTLFCDQNESAYAALERCLLRLADCAKELVDVETNESLPFFATEVGRIGQIERDLEHYLCHAELTAQGKNLFENNEISKPRRILVTDESDVSDENVSSQLEYAQREIDNFRNHNWRQFWALSGLKLRDRRQAHALAHISGFAHVSLGSGGEKVVLVSKRKDLFPASLKRTIRLWSRQKNASNILWQSSGSSQAHYDAFSQIAAHDIYRPFGRAQAYYDALSQAPNEATKSFRSPARSTTHSSESGVSIASCGSGHKRRRQSRHEGAFLCEYIGCSEKFDRKCDLTQHERSHMPYEQRPYACESCVRRFLFPKDLKRHEEIHKNVSERFDDPDDDLGNMQALIKMLENTRAERRAPSTCAALPRSRPGRAPNSEVIT